MDKKHPFCRKERELKFIFFVGVPYNIGMKKFTFLLVSTFCVVTSAFSLCVREISNAEMPVSGTETTFHVVVDA